LIDQVAAGFVLAAFAKAVGPQRGAMRRENGFPAAVFFNWPAVPIWLAVVRPMLAPP
jgi:hypothetical protein